MWVAFFVHPFTTCLAMARARPEYDEFVALVNPENLAIRAALFGHFFPEGINTRCPVTFEFKVGL